MKISAVILTALAGSAFGVVQNCAKAGLAPYCCESVVAAPIGSFSIGVECIKAKTGKRTHCPSKHDQKQCCEKQASTFGPITLCDTTL